jgi:hypothetical protein
MSNPYIQVALTYIRRTGRIVAAVACIPIALFVIVVISGFFARLCLGNPKLSADLVSASAAAFYGVASSAVRSVPILLVLVLILSLAAASHLREQFANPRARLLPHFARVHIAVAAVVVLCIAILLPAFLARLAGCDCFGFLAITVFISGILLWTGSFRWNGWLAAIALYIGIGASADNGINWIRRMRESLVSGQAVGTAVLLLGLGAFMMVLAWRRLTCLHEEKLGYGRPSQTGAKLSLPVRIQGRGWLFGFMQMLKGLDEEREVSRILRHAQCAYTSSWSRACRWQAGMGTGRSLWLFAFGAILAAQFLFWNVSTYSGSEWDSRALLLLASLPWLILAPAASLSQFYQRRQVIGHELLMPVTRKAYFGELGLAALLAQFQLWSAAAVATVLWWVIASRQSVSMATVMGVLAFSALLQFTFFATAVWLTRYPVLLGSLFVLALIGIVPITATAVTAARWFAERPYAACSAGAAILAALDLLLIWGAYRRWLITDFG